MMFVDLVLYSINELPSQVWLTLKKENGQIHLLARYRLCKYIVLNLVNSFDKIVDIIQVA